MKRGDRAARKGWLLAEALFGLAVLSLAALAALGALRTAERAERRSSSGGDATGCLEAALFNRTTAAAPPEGACADGSAVAVSIHPLSPALNDVLFHDRTEGDDNARRAIEAVLRS